MLALEQISLDTESLIEYLVDGVPECHEKIILYGSATLDDLKIKFMDYERSKK